MNQLTFADIEKSSLRIKNFIDKTPIITNEELNKKLGGEVFFKCENLQKTLSFKARGAFNAILTYQEKHHKFPEKIVAVSSGNHAQAVAYACKLFNIPALIYMAQNTPQVKVLATKAYGAEVILCEKRWQANQWAEEKAADGYFFIHPSANNNVIAGQGTACLEALQEIGKVAAIFVPCGGGGLAAGTFFAAQNSALTFACEPLNGNDAARSLRAGKILSYQESPNTIADGARTLAVAEPCFSYLKKIAGILEISEEEIILWQEEFFAATSTLIEPTSALAIAGAAQYLKNNPAAKILVIISGGNVAKKT